MSDSSIELNGHQVPADRVDLFRDGRTGQPITDAQWDEQKRRLAAAEALQGEDAVTWEPVGGIA